MLSLRCLSHTVARSPSSLLSRVSSVSHDLSYRHKGLWSQESNDGTEKTNRWSMLLPAVATHISLGAPYGWSAISSALAREQGFVTSGAADWSLDLVTYPMSIILAVGGISAALAGKWQIKVTHTSFESTNVELSSENF